MSLLLIKLTSKSKNEEKGEKNMTFDFRKGSEVTPELLQKQRDNESSAAKSSVKMHWSCFEHEWFRCREIVSCGSRPPYSEELKSFQAHLQQPQLLVTLQETHLMDMTFTVRS